MRRALTRKAELAHQRACVILASRISADLYAYARAVRLWHAAVQGGAMLFYEIVRNISCDVLTSHPFINNHVHFRPRRYLAMGWTLTSQVEGIHYSRRY